MSYAKRYAVRNAVRMRNAMLKRSEVKRSEVNKIKNTHHGYVPHQPNGIRS